MSFRIVIRTPEAVVREQDVDGLVIPGSRGFYGVLQRHAPMLGSVVAGILTLRHGDGTSHVIVGNGIADILPERVEILTDEATVVGADEDPHPVLAERLRKRALPPAEAPESVRSVS